MFAFRGTACAVGWLAGVIDEVAGRILHITRLRQALVPVAVRVGATKIANLHVMIVCSSEVVLKSHSWILIHHLDSVYMRMCVADPPTGTCGVASVGTTDISKCEQIIPAGSQLVVDLHRSVVGTLAGSPVAWHVDHTGIRLIFTAQVIAIHAISEFLKSPVVPRYWLRTVAW